MSLTPGTRLGPYEIVAPLGAGGMGEVYRARDTRLERDVAIKVLPDEFARDPERLARFEREAKLLASLKHPNIAAIYGLEEDAGRRFLALECVEGSSLAERISRGRLPLDDALDLGRQIASALEAAHEGGVIHRDLKPANVMITDGGEVKVLDFGLAKGTATSAPDTDDLSRSPTLTVGATGAGVVLGTAAYMSPEQARGKAVDKRTDIWSFGCVLYECLTGRRAFEGETVSDMIARILQGEPEWAALPPQTPTKVRDLLQRCLEKDAKKRLRDIGDARIEIEQTLASRTASERMPVASEADSKRVRAAAGRALAIGVLLGAALGMGLWSLFGPATRGHADGKQAVARLAIKFPPEVRVGFILLSPDGETLVAWGSPRVAEGAEEPRSRAYVRRLEGYDLKELPGTEDANSPKFSPDGRGLFFRAPLSIGASQQKLARIAVDGSSPPVTIAPWQDNWSSMAVLESGEVLIFADQGRSMVRIPPNSGTPGSSVKVDAGGQRRELTLGRTLPHDRGVLLNATSYGARGYYFSVCLLDPRTGRVSMLIEEGGNPAYSPSGHLLFTRGGTLLAAPFDLGHLKVTGPPVAVLSGIRADYTFGVGWFQLGENGALLYFPGGIESEQRRLAIVESGGNVQPLSQDRRRFLTEEGSLGNPAVSADGRRFAALIINAKGINEIWGADLERPALRRQVAIPTADCFSPLLSPDGRRLAFTRNGSDSLDGLYIKEFDSAEPPRRLLGKRAVDDFYSATGWAPNGSALLVTRYSSNGGDVLRLSLSALPESLSKLEPLLTSDFDESSASVAPEGRSMTFASNESGQSEVYACSMKPDGTVGNSIRLSKDGGWSPLWSSDGREIFYWAPRGRLMSVKIGLQPALSAQEPAMWLDTRKLRIASGTPLPNGRLLAIIKGDEEKDEFPDCNVVLNWTKELARKMGSAK